MISLKSNTVSIFFYKFNKVTYEDIQKRNGQERERDQEREREREWSGTEQER